ncbi:hypothetical protein [Glycomyces tritici]|uniref:Uncharacterized protein n=1 Tax=Glycomyces tritici TaxID=2665176 RepID=A0ABT7YN57_9ACTN|nr:hypothetical protein [Glycomyces tritici]MDN3239703.1 hypothetical protein [Glycomyces tritici]
MFEFSILVFGCSAVIGLLYTGFRAHLAGLLAGALTGGVTAWIALAADAENGSALARGALAALIGLQVVAWGTQRRLRAAALRKEARELERNRALARRYRRTDEEWSRYRSPD